MGRAFKSLPVNPEQVRRAFPNRALTVRENTDAGTAEVEVDGLTDVQVQGTLATIVYDASVEPAEKANDRTIRQQARDALTANRSFVAIASPSNAQNAAQVKALTRQNNGLIRLLLGLLDGTD